MPRDVCRVIEDDRVRNEGVAGSVDVKGSQAMLEVEYYT